MSRAACTGTSPGAFYPEHDRITRAAKQACASCPVRAECLEYALELGETFGVWGGLTAGERRRVRRERSRQARRARLAVGGAA